MYIPSDGCSQVEDPPKNPTPERMSCKYMPGTESLKQLRRVPGKSVLFVPFALLSFQPLLGLEESGGMKEEDIQSSSEF